MRRPDTHEGRGEGWGETVQRKKKCVQMSTNIKPRKVCVHVRRGVGKVTKDIVCQAEKSRVYLIAAGRFNQEKDRIESECGNIFTVERKKIVGYSPRRDDCGLN